MLRAEPHASGEGGSPTLPGGRWAHPEEAHLYPSRGVEDARSYPSWVPLEHGAVAEIIQEVSEERLIGSTGNTENMGTLRETPTGSLSNPRTGPGGQLLRLREIRARLCPAIAGVSDKDSHLVSHMAHDSRRSRAGAAWSILATGPKVTRA